MEDIDEDAKPDGVRQESKPLLDNPLTASIGMQILCTLCIFIQVLSHVMSVVSTQVAGLDINIFQYNTIRYFIEALVAFCVAWHCKDSIKILREDLSFFVTVGILDMTASVCIFATVTFLPVGNLDAFFNAVFVVIATCYDVMRREVSYLGVVTYVTLGVGILLLTQPWNTPEQGALMHTTPCYYLDKSHNISDMLDYNASRLPNTTLPMVTEETDEPNPADLFVRYYYLLGYTLLIIAALEYNGHGKLSRFLLKKYQVSTVIFWVALLEGMLSFTVSIIWQSLRQESFLMVPAGSYCVFFMCLYIIFIGVSNFSAYYVLSYFQGSAYAVFLLCSTLLLYIIQRTGLKHFHPGNANLVEILGVVLILFGIAGLPLLGKLVKSKKSESESN